MPDVQESINRLAQFLDEHEKHCSFTINSKESTDRIFDKLDGLGVQLAAIKEHIIGTDNKVDGINFKLDKINGSVQDLKLNKVDRTEYKENKVETDKVSETMLGFKRDLYWIVFIGGPILITVAGICTKLLLR